MNPSEQPPAAFVGWTTCPDADSAERLARTLVTERLAACAQVSGPLISFYEWRDAIERAEEWRITLKFTGATAAALARRLAEIHPHDTPQWIAVRADIVSPDYLAWMGEG